MSFKEICIVAAAEVSWCSWASALTPSSLDMVLEELHTAAAAHGCLDSII
jgi:hypothetical protein